MESEPHQARVAIVDDQRSFVDALALAVSLTDDMNVVGAAADIDAGFEMVARLRPNLVVTDFRLAGSGDGLDLATRIRETEQLSTTPVLIVTGFTAPQVVRGARNLRGVSVVSKDNSMSRLMDAFRSAIAGDVTFDENPPDDGGLTVAELEVLELLGQGRQAAQIADELYLSLHAIRARIKTMLRKLDVSSQLEAVAKATRMGLIVPPTMGTEQSSDDS